MYVASELNRSGLFQRLGGYQQSIAPGTPPLDNFLFRATAIVRSLRRVNYYYRSCSEIFKRYESQLTLTGEPIAIWTPELVDIISELSHVLSHLRTAQNLFIQLVPRPTREISVPLSMADAAKNLDACGFSTEVAALIKSYWTAHGARLKNYRDIDQHFFLMADNAFIRVKPTQRLMIYLPDDPSNKSIRKQSRELKLDALDFSEQAFGAFNMLAESVFESLGFPSVPIKQVVPTTHLGLTTTGAYKTIGITNGGDLESREIRAGEGNLSFRPLKPA